MCLARQDCARPLRVRKERETFPQTTRGGSCCCKELPARAGWGCVWTSAPVHPPSSELPAGLQDAAPLHEMKAAGELLPRQCVLGLCATPAGSQQFPLALRSCAELSVVPAAISLQSADVEAGWSWVIPSLQTQLTHSSYPAAALERALLSVPSCSHSNEGHSSHLCFPRVSFICITVAPNGPK